MHKSWGASLFSLEHSSSQIVVFIYPFGSSDLLIACFTLCYANEINLCHVLCAMCLAIMTRLKLYNSGFTCGYHVLINYNLFVYASFFVDAYHADYWLLRTFYTQESSYRYHLFLVGHLVWFILTLWWLVRGWKWVHVCIAYILAHSCVLDAFWTHTWHDDHIGYSYYILSKICSLDLLNVFPPMFNRIFISYYLVAF